MNALPEPLESALQQALGAKIVWATPLGGGMIHCAAQVETTQGTVLKMLPIRRPGRHKQAFKADYTIASAY